MFRPFRSPWFNLPLIAAVAAANSYANGRRQSWGDGLAALLFLTYAVYCVQNFARCREVHCAFTAPGFLIATIVMALRIAGLASYQYGLGWIIFAVSACVGYCVQRAYEHRTGSVFLKRY